MNVYSILSDVLLFLMFFDILRNYLNKNYERCKKYISYFFWVVGINLTLKFMFKIERDVGFVKYSFPSTHAALSIIPFFIYKNPLLLIYALIIGILRVLAGYHNLLEVIVGYISSYFSLLLFNFLEKKVEFETHRKAFHIGLSVIIGSILFFNSFYGQLLLFLALLASPIFFYFKNRKPIRDLLEWYDRDFSGKGALTLVIGLLLASFLLENSYIAAFYLGWIDSLATIFGKIFNTNKKSYYGFLGGLIGGFIAVLITNTSYILPFLLSLVEYITPRRIIDDNITIPIAIILFINIFHG